MEESQKMEESQEIILDGVKVSKEQLQEAQKDKSKRIRLVEGTTNQYKTLTKMND